MHTLFIGSPRGLPFTQEGRSLVVRETADRFPAFTVSDAEGFFRGRSVATLLVRLASDDSGAVRRLAAHLGRVLHQKEIGMEMAGVFRTIMVGDGKLNEQLPELQEMT